MPAREGACSLIELGEVQRCGGSKVIHRHRTHHPCAPHPGHEEPGATQYKQHGSPPPLRAVRPGERAKCKQEATEQERPECCRVLPNDRTGRNRLSGKHTAGLTRKKRGGYNRLQPDLSELFTAGSASLRGSFLGVGGAFWPRSLRISGKNSVKKLFSNSCNDISAPRENAVLKASSRS